MLNNQTKTKLIEFFIKLRKIASHIFNFPKRYFPLSFAAKARVSFKTIIQISCESEALSLNYPFHLLYISPDVSFESLWCIQGKNLSWYCKNKKLQVDHLHCFHLRVISEINPPDIFQWRVVPIIFFSIPEPIKTLKTAVGWCVFLFKKSQVPLRGRNK